MTVAALNPNDKRSVQAEIAEPAALLVAKLHKLQGRIAGGREGRLNDKDAADVLRIMQTTEPPAVAATFTELCQELVAGQPSTDALAYLDTLFGRRGRPGVRMAASALRTAMPEARVEAICVSYATALRRTLGPAS